MEQRTHLCHIDYLISIFGFIVISHRSINHISHLVIDMNTNNHTMIPMLLLVVTRCRITKIGDGHRCRMMSIAYHTLVRHMIGFD